MDKLQIAKENYNLLGEFPNARRLSNGVYRVNPCPKCGGHDHFTVYEPNSSNNKNNWWTYSSFNATCCNGGSVVDYLIEFKGLTMVQAIEELTIGETSSKIKKDIKIKPIVNDPKEVKEKKYDFTGVVDKLYEQCINSEGINYFKARGLDKTIDIYKLGYEEYGYNKALEGFNELYNKSYNEKSYKYFIPIFDKNNKVVRVLARCDKNITSGNKILNMVGLTQVLFNQRYLEAPPQDKFIFICEGWADALSLEEIGRKAIALNSTGMVKKFIGVVQNNISKLKNKIFIIALDTDEAGAKATDKLKDAFADLKLTTKVLNIDNKYKDINEFLVADKKGLEKAVANIEEEVISSAYKFSSGSSLFSSLLEEVEYNFSNGGVTHVSTGFNELDRKIGGGLYNGLYVIGAGSSIGKTTMVQQIADNIANNGKKVLFFSLEMGKKEMLSKTIVRELFKKGNSNIGAREFLNGNLQERDWINLATQSDSITKTLENIFYLEGNFGTTIEEIVNTSREFKNIYGVSPVIIVDYLQVISPVDVRIGDKQNVDKSIAELKRLSRDLETPVIAISSVNRQNYLSHIDFSSFKESGSIEYGADVVLGLQLSAIHSILADHGEGDKNISKKRIEYNKAKAETPRKIEVVILKNRYGASTGAHEYLYHPKFNLFEEVDNTFTQSNADEENEASSLFD